MSVINRRGGAKGKDGSPKSMCFIHLVGDEIYMMRHADGANVTVKVIMIKLLATVDICAKCNLNPPDSWGRRGGQTDEAENVTCLKMSLKKNLYKVTHRRHISTSSLHQTHNGNSNAWLIKTTVQ